MSDSQSAYFSRTRFLWARCLPTVALLTPLLLFGAVACSSLPAQPPPQLQHTPGPSLVVGERTLQTPTYRVDPPAGWRVVKSTIASEPIVLVLVAPDDSMVIHVGEEPVPTFALEEAVISRDAVVKLPNDESVYLRGKGKREVKDQFEAVFETVQRSVRLPE